MRFQNHLDAFKQHLVDRAVSPRTLEAYSYHASRFLAFVESHYPLVWSIKHVSPEVVRAYVASLRTLVGRTGEAIANRTQVLKVKSVRALFAFLALNRRITRDPTLLVDGPREQDTFSRNVLSKNQVKRVIHGVRPIDPVSTRNRAIVELLYACGLRTSELCALKLGDVDIRSRTLTVFRGKGGRSRVVPIGRHAAYYIQSYLLKARESDQRQLFFPSHCLG